MNVNQAEATKHHSELIIHILVTAGLKQNGPLGEFFDINLQFSWKTNPNICSL